jgi:hypothetical protein
MLLSTSSVGCHHHVAGAVGLEVAVDANNVRMAESRQRARFLDEGVKPPLIIKLVVRRYRNDAAVERTHRKITRQVFLDRDVFLEIGIPCEIGHAEAADAQHGLQLILAKLGT